MNPSQREGIFLSTGVLKSIQNLSPPSFFLTRTTALLQAELLSFIAPTSNMWSRCSFTSCNNPSGMFHGHSLKGQGSVTSIWCSVTSVHPISPCFSAKTLCSGIQDSSPDRSNFSKSFSLHSSMDSC